MLKDYSTRFKKGNHYSVKTEFKKGGLPWNKGKKCPQLSGENHHNWNGGKRISLGYIYLYNHNHPKKDKNGYIPESHSAMERHLGRYLQDEEVVHHINGIKNDNRIENLLLFKNQSEHRRFHIKHFICSVKNCGKKHSAKGLCSNHYQKFRLKYGGKSKKTCLMDNCDSYIYGRNLCKLHYQQWYRSKNNE
jgi:hypothetical protein